MAVIKAGAERGWYKEYRWAFGEEDLALAVGYKGPAVLGIYWFDGMSSPDQSGVIVPKGELMGGHAILCNGYNVKSDMYRLHNSWGNQWGLNGECFISALHLSLLLKVGGEACIPVIRSK